MKNVGECLRAAALVAAFAAALAAAAEVKQAAPEHQHADFPAAVQADARYVVYSHGRIAEGSEERPVSAEHGVYDLPAIRASLASAGDAQVIAPHRAKDADTTLAAQHLENGVRRLIAGGVKPSRITLVGFSRGGYITALASSRLADLHINTAILAICTDGDPAKVPMTLAGNVLSIYETSDDVGSCHRLRERSRAAQFEEIGLSTGLGHGALYRPIEAWIGPLQAWMARTSR